MPEKNSLWKGCTTLVTGGNGFLGRNLVPRIKERCDNVIVPASREYDLRNHESVQKLFRESKPDIVIHAAVHGGGIGHMRQNPGSIYYDNTMMNTLVTDEARKSRVKKFIGIGTICSYPKYTSVPFKEENLWNGYPEETNAPYGLAKKMMLVQTNAYREQYGFNGIHLLLVNMYGPYDDYNPDTSHVIPALIRKFTEAKREGRKTVEAWGTGQASREFLYVKDAVEGIILATERYDKGDPVNIGAGFEIKIKDLVDLIAELTGFDGEIIWDASKPDGQPRRCLDTSRAEKEFGFKAGTPFRQGLKKTIEWYEENCL
ncbi:MAG: GDP-L-fucose synthase [Candidatus Altiarchaeia archaeon]